MMLTNFYLDPYRIKVVTNDKDIDDIITLLSLRRVLIVGGFGRPR